MFQQSLMFNFKLILEKKIFSAFNFLNFSFNRFAFVFLFLLKLFLFIERQNGKPREAFIWI